MTKPTAKSTLTPAAFAAKWSQSELKERAAYQAHWNDICAMLGQPTPTDYDLKGDEYCFEKGAQKADGSDGWADVWWRGKFAVEYKAPGKDLDRAFRQLNDYRGELEQPPLLMVCDHFSFRIVTNFTNSRQVRWSFTLNELGSNTKIESDPPVFDPAAPVELLRQAFENPGSLNPSERSAKLTQDAASRFGEIAEALRTRSNGKALPPLEAAHFLMKCLFCLFAEGTGILPPKTFSNILALSKEFQDEIQQAMTDLFRAMANGSNFMYQRVRHVNGGLFDGTPAPKLRESEIAMLRKAAKIDWSNVEPAIFGTLFERALDPNQRKRLGAHYTSREDIMLVIEPVILRPLRREWHAIKAETAGLKQEIRELLDAEENGKGTGKKHAAALAKARKDYASRLNAFLDRLCGARVLDPACGSGNFLYVALYEMKLLEAEVTGELRAAGIETRDFWLGVGPKQFLGFEINEYAFELAQTVIWLGYLQWWRDHREGPLREPVLDKLDTIKLKDALLEIGPDGKPEDPPRMTEWPEAEFIVGNPPFIGGNKVRKVLGDQYIEALFRRYDGQVERFADIVTYWHERARQQIAAGKTKRAGLLATQGIRGGAGQKTLKKILETGGIFEAWSDRDWTLDGASVHISIVCQDDGSDREVQLDGFETEAINADLTSVRCTDLTGTNVLKENLKIALRGDEKGGPFDVDWSEARRLLSISGNPNRRPNSEVVRPYWNGRHLMGRWDQAHVIDFGVAMPESEATMYEAPYEYVLRHVRPERMKNRVEGLRSRWWLHRRPGPDMRELLSPLERFVVTAAVAKHRVFAWCPKGVIPDHQLIVFARDDDYFFGVLHSTMHELWALRLGTQLREKESGFRYTPTTCFETFPLPKPTKAQEKAIAEAARELNEKREAWLNPPELVAAAGAPTAPSASSDLMTTGKKKSKSASLSLSKGAAGRSEPTSDPSTSSGNRKSGPTPGADLPLDAAQARKELARRTLTNLYNARPTWLHNLHVKLDQAVLAAYGWTDISVEHLHATRVAPAWGVDTPVHHEGEQSASKVGKSAHPPGNPRPATATECAALQKAAETEILRRLLELNRERSGKK